MRMQTSIEFVLILSAVALLSISVISLYGKQISAQSRALGELANSSQENITISNYSNYTAAAYTPSSSYSANITNTSEEISYGMEPFGEIMNITETSHCTAYNFFNHPFGIAQQCGTSNAWEYIAASTCATTSTYCIYPDDTGHVLTRVNESRRYLYDFTFTIRLPPGSAKALISSNESVSPLKIGNKTIGYVRVLNVTSSESAPSSELIGYGASFWQLNQTAYERYIVAKNLLYPLLAYYNSTGVDFSTQSAIQEAIYSFVSSSNSLRNSSSSPERCGVENNRYICRAIYPFFYSMDINVSGGVGVDNQTLYYLGSVIRVTT